MEIAVSPHYTRLMPENFVSVANAYTTDKEILLNVYLPLFPSEAFQKRMPWTEMDMYWVSFDL